jgi:hypothetical protein
VWKWKSKKGGRKTEDMSNLLVLRRDINIVADKDPRSVLGNVTLAPFSESMSLTLLCEMEDWKRMTREKRNEQP